MKQVTKLMDILFKPLGVNYSAMNMPSLIDQTKVS